MARWRLAGHLRQQDWAAVAIDLAIVVLGVFLGIQASNWNDERRNRRIANRPLSTALGQFGILRVRARWRFFKSSSWQ